MQVSINKDVTINPESCSRYLSPMLTTASIEIFDQRERPAAPAVLLLGANLQARHTFHCIPIRDQRGLPSAVKPKTHAVTSVIGVR